MPFKSQSQRAWMYANHPDMAKRWQADTPKGTTLPMHVALQNAAKKRKKKKSNAK